jgi:LmbE family N-acetylglucosaminyl deacetylase
MMKKLILFMLLALLSIANRAQESAIRVIVFGAHPDDCDEVAGGTAILFSKMGCKVKFVSMTNGDAGHQSMGGGALAKIRMAEAQEAGRRFGVEYTVLDNHDGELMPTLENRLKVIREIRNWKADLVITHPPNDYHPDHRYTSILVQDASYMVIVPNIAPDTPPLKQNPVFMYPTSSAPDIAVDIDAVYRQKLYALSAHESQFFEWLPWTEGILDQVPKDKEDRLNFIAKMDRPINDEIRACLKKCYGEAYGAKVVYAEAFKLTEFGRHADYEELLKLFPMISKKK